MIERDKCDVCDIPERDAELQWGTTGKRSTTWMYVCDLCARDLGVTFSGAPPEEVLDHG